MHFNRRHALASLLSMPLAASPWMASPQASSAWAADATDAATSPRSPYPLGIFTKPFNSISYDELAEKTAELGLDGIEATVRRGGNVLPERVQEDLPKLVEALAKQDLKILLMASDITDSQDPVHRRVLETAADLGIERFRMSYFKYDLKQPIAGQIDRWRLKFESLAELCRRRQILGMYQNHAGERYMGAAIWDLDRVLADISPDEIGVAFDIRHAAVEAGTCWPVAWQLILPRVRTLYAKDFQWEGSKVTNVPLGTGRTPMRFFEDLATTDFSGPISLHEEYLDHKPAELVPQHWAAIGRDLATLRGHLSSSS